MLKGKIDKTAPLYLKTKSVTMALKSLNLQNILLNAKNKYLEQIQLKPTVIRNKLLGHKELGLKLQKL